MGSRLKTVILSFISLIVVVWALKVFTDSILDQISLSIVFAFVLTYVTYLIWKRKVPIPIPLGKRDEKKRRRLMKFLSVKGFFPDIKIFENKNPVAFSTQLFEKRPLVFISTAMFREWSLASLQGVMLHEQHHLNEKDSLKRLVRTFFAVFSFFITYFFFEKWMVWAFVFFAVIELIHNRRQEYKADEFAYNHSPGLIVNSLLSLQYEITSKRDEKIRPLSFHPKVILDYFYNLIVVNFLYSLYLVYLDIFSIHPSVKTRLKNLLKKDPVSLLRKSEISKKTKGKRFFFKVST